jgi:hypothetical protein
MDRRIARARLVTITQGTTAIVSVWTGACQLNEGTARGVRWPGGDGLADDERIVSICTNHFIIALNRRLDYRLCRISLAGVGQRHN